MTYNSSRSTWQVYCPSSRLLTLADQASSPKQGYLLGSCDELHPHLSVALCSLSSGLPHLQPFSCAVVALSLTVRASFTLNFELALGLISVFERLKPY
jgi:hypothetical protein